LLLIVSRATSYRPANFLSQVWLRPALAFAITIAGTATLKSVYPRVDSWLSFVLVIALSCTMALAFFLLVVASSAERQRFVYRPLVTLVCGSSKRFWLLWRRL
jgi:hypothetical protein